jgi:hypothetical protein
VTVRVDSIKRKYVLGEPVLIDAVVTNVSDRDIHVWVDILRAQQIDILIASAGEEFRQFMGEIAVRGFYDVSPETEALEPGASRTYAFRVLYTPPSMGEKGKPWHLAFGKPGFHRVKARYRGLAHAPVESETLQVEIKEPDWIDAALWKEINSPELLYLLQAGHLRLEDQRHGTAILERALQLYQRPKSSYHPALEDALKGIYQARRHEILEELKLLSRWRRVLAIEEPLPMLLNPKVWVKRTRPQHP